jgi:hypothetical protein
MTGSQLRLKQPTGWFAAGREVAQALSLLSDGVFKLFMWICLNADRGLGAMRVEPIQVARVLGKTEAEIRADLRDLFQTEIGQPTPDGAIQIADRYWPYERAPTGQQAEKLATYISQLKRAFLERRCVRTRFHCRGREHRNPAFPCRRGHRGCRTRDFAGVASEVRRTDQQRPRDTHH